MILPKKICTYLNEHDIYRQLDSIDAVNYNKKPWLTITRDWRSYVKYITNEGNVFLYRSELEDRTSKLENSTIL